MWLRSCKVASTYMSGRHWRKCFVVRLALWLHTVAQSMDSVQENEKVPPVTAVSFCPMSGLLVVAHQGGKVRLYILGTEDREVTQHNIDADGKIGKGRQTMWIRYAVHRSQATK